MKKKKPKKIVKRQNAAAMSLVNFRHKVQPNKKKIEKLKGPAPEFE